jgi:hypothetical protein
MNKSIAATVLLAAALAAGCAVTTTPTLSVGGTPPAAGHLCPPKLPQAQPPFPSGWTDLDEPSSTLVPGSPTGARACRYERLNDPRPGTLARAVTLDAVRADRLATAFDQAKPPPGGVYSCPVDVGGFDLVLFDYADGSQVAVLDALSGCGEATNGRRAVGFTEAADALLATYVGAPNPSGR